MIALRPLGAMRHVQATIAAALVAFAMAAVAAVNAIRIEPLPAPDSESPTAVTALQAAPRTSADAIDGAVAAAPFAPGRQPGVAQDQAAVTVIERQAIVLVGTVFEANGDSFILASVGTGPARVLRVGETLEGLRLRTVEQGKAVFTNIQTGERLELRVPRSRP